jgi:hypothetical protein
LLTGHLQASAKPEHLVDRSVRFYETSFGGRILSRDDSNGSPGYVQVANTGLIVDVGPPAGQLRPTDGCTFMMKNDF